MKKFFYLSTLLGFDGGGKSLVEDPETNLNS